MTGKKASAVLLLLAVAILTGALVAAVWLSPVLCHHYHLSCP